MKGLSRKRRQRALTTILERFAAWSDAIPAACHKGCATCCTLGVTASETEGEIIIDYVQAHGLTEWFTRRLQDLPSLAGPVCTTNEFARACLAGKDHDPGNGCFSGTCPFLVDTVCQIYPVRPFGCRSFISTIRCRPNHHAELPSSYLSGVTAVSQVIEHLDQGRRWGFLGTLTRTMLFEEEHAPASSRDQLLRAKPLPGFLISEEDFPTVSRLLETIFSATLDNTTIHALLNGD